jgi:hypothetical protein
MARNTHYYSNKKSEYRVNYLPFDYYDFWITAKENENLRFKNKLRDYLHTPFDWDENLEVYQESEAVVGAAAEAAAAAAANAAAAEAEKAEKARLAALARNLERLNQATQTTSRPNRHDHLKKIAQDNERQKHTQQQIQQASNLEKSVQTVINNRGNKKSVKNGRKKSKDRLNANNVKKSINTRPTKSAGVQVNFEYSKKRDQATNSGQLTVAPRCQSAKYPIARNQRNQSSFKLDHCCDHGKEKTDANLVRSLSNMSIQTPMEWNLRDYSRTSLRSAKSI